MVGPLHLSAQSMPVVANNGKQTPMGLCLSQYHQYQLFDTMVNKHQSLESFIFFGT